MLRSVDHLDDVAAADLAAAHDAPGTLLLQDEHEGLEVLDEDTWHPHLLDFSDPMVSDQWGTANAMDEFVAKKSFNDPDKGVFVAPPV